MYLQILQEPHGTAWSCMELHGTAWSHCVNFKYYRSRMETLSIKFRDAWSHMEQHGITVSISNTTGAVWRPLQLSLEMHGAAWSRMEPHGAAWSRLKLRGATWSHRFNFKYYRNRMETFSIRSRNARNRIEPHGATV